MEVHKNHQGQVKESLRIFERIQLADALTAFSAASSRSSAVINAIPLSCAHRETSINLFDFYNLFCFCTDRCGSFCFLLSWKKRIILPLESSFLGQHWCPQDELQQVPSEKPLTQNTVQKIHDSD